MKVMPLTMTTLDLDALVLAEGKHTKPDDGMCVMEAVAYVAGEPFTDHPECASPILGDFLRSWNDSLPDADRQLLRPFIPRLVGTNTGAEDEETRAWMLTDWLARECAPGFLLLAGLTDQAELLEKLAPITSNETAVAAQPTLNRARTDSAAARAAAWAAAGDAAWADTGAAAWATAGDAAWATAVAAAGAAAWADTGAAAWDAARDAAWAAAGAAAGKGGDYDAQYAAAKAAAAPLIEAKFADTTKALQTSALQLLDRMIAVSEKAAA